MATRAQDHDDHAQEGAARRDHDEWVRAKVLNGLEQSRDRASLVPIEQVWRDLLP